MLILVMANNYLLLFIGWEGVGLASYLLIGFYFKRKPASDAAMKAFLMNRLGDAGYLMALFFLLGIFGTLRFTAIEASVRWHLREPHLEKRQHGSVRENFTEPSEQQGI